MSTTAAGEVLQAVRARLASYDLTFSSEELDYTNNPSMWKGELRFGDASALVRVVLAAPMTLTALTQFGLDDQHLVSSTLPTLIVGRQVHERSAGAFREMGVNYADAVGNAYIRFASVLIDVRGRRSTHQEDRSASPDQKTMPPQSSNLFSAGRAQVVATFLAWPKLTLEPVRQVARAAGVSTGQAHSALALLEETGYLVDRKLRPDRVDELLDLWTAAYPRGLGQKLAVASYTSGKGIDTLRAELLEGAVDSAGTDALVISGESVAGLGVTRPTTLTVYARDWDPRQAIRYRWRAANSTAEADIHVRRRFWTFPTDTHSEGEQPPTAPWPIVYADLVSTGDQRLAEVAAEWRDRHRAS